MIRHLICALFALCLLLVSAPARATVIWTEGEAPRHSTMHRHPWWYDKVDRAQLSGGDFISNWSDKPGEADYEVSAPEAGNYQFWVRANPVGTRLEYRLNGGEWIAIDLQKEKQGDTNIAEGGTADLRFIAWEKVGQVQLSKGANAVAFRMDSQNNNHGMLDCFVLANEPFVPNGIHRPGETALPQKEADGNWMPFAPGPDDFDKSADLDLRSINEEAAGEGGFIAVEGPEFVHGKTGKPVRFWAVNGPPGEMKDPDQLRQCARMLAKHGVNLVRIHGGYYDRQGKLDPNRIRRLIDVVKAMKAQGIYSHLSIYFPLWLDPDAGNPVLKGYNGKQHPFATLYFDPGFQELYHQWWKAILTTPGTDGSKLIDEPAVFGAELINEDSLFFWTFNAANIPDPEMRIIEKRFGDWLAKQYGSIDAAMGRWGGLRTKRDAPGDGRVGFRPMWNMFHDRTPRDRDTARFLTELQRDFYAQQEQFLRGIGFKGVVTGSNWTTADAGILGPLDKYSYTVNDFIDRHGYFDCDDHGPNDGFAIMNGQTYADRSALRFDPSEPGKPRQFLNSIMDPRYDGKPSMISETTFNRPNRYRSEAPLYYACYGALQGSDCIIHFALDSAGWSTRPGYFMQPWTLMSPAMMGQFPAAALIYRQRLVEPGAVLADIKLSVSDVESLKGTPLPQGAALDELRLKDVKGAADGGAPGAGSVVDPLIHYVGRTDVSFVQTGATSHVADLSPFIDHARRTVASTTHQLLLDYGKGVLTIDAPAAQGVSGNLKEAGAIDLGQLSIQSEMPLGHIVAVSLDGQPLSTSGRILLQVMSEEKSTGFRTEPAAAGHVKIDDIGHDPWLIRELSGTVRFKRADAGSLKVTALDANGKAIKSSGPARDIKLLPDVIYYLIGK